MWSPIEKGLSSYVREIALGTYCLITSSRKWQGFLNSGNSLSDTALTLVSVSLEGVTTGHKITPTTSRHTDNTILARYKTTIADTYSLKVLIDG